MYKTLRFAYLHRNADLGEVMATILESLEIAYKKAIMENFDI